MAIDVSPRFTLSLRGYDKDEVDDYLESVVARTSEADTELYELRERARQLETEHQRLIDRIDELEDAIRGETPHTVRALGERITLILTEAEAGAAETLTQARMRADALVSEAESDAETMRRQALMFQAQANETLAGAQRQAEELAEQLEAGARTRVASIVSDAEGRARRRQEQIEGWAQEVIARTHAEQQKMSEEFAALRRRHEAHVVNLMAQRDEVVDALRSLQAALGRAVDGVPSAGAAPSSEASDGRALAGAAPDATAPDYAVPAPGTVPATPRPVDEDGAAIRLPAAG